MKLQIAAACTALAVLLAPGAYCADGKEGPSKIDRALEKTNEVVDDSAITAKIKAEYAKDKTVSALKIHVETDQGVVKLTGKARSKQEVSKAVQIAKSVHGVASVTNHIKLAASNSKK